ncbi:MAG TPA: carboxyl transferase domain-containing protein [Acidimicrobiales bacterium]|nr:carboxyl transferase domain-containing protein [Acidimicrobiales bacterium]
MALPSPLALSLQAQVPGSLDASVEELGGRQVVLVRSDPTRHRGALTAPDGPTLAAAAGAALEARVPLVAVLSTSGAEVGDGIAALHGWGQAARALSACSGAVPVAVAMVGPAVSGPALLLGLADLVVMTPEAFAFVSGPGMVAQFTGIQVDVDGLGGPGVHATRTGLGALQADDEDQAIELVAQVLSHLPANADEEPPVSPTTDPPDRPTPELREVLPDSERGSYDVREVARSLADDGRLVELRPRWAPQVVTALARVEGRPVGVVANQPRTLAGTLDIAASQKGARFVAWCDAFNLPLVTLVDTPGFLPGKDLEWRGMIRHGAELAFAYARATVPRVAVILRKAYGGAYIVMDSRGMGSDVCLAWPSAEVAVMGAQGAAQVLYRREDDQTRARREAAYRDAYLTPWVAAERGLVDAVIDPAETRVAVADALATLATKQEHLVARKHDNAPL